MKHKWAKEIKAWADGAEIEGRNDYGDTKGDWHILHDPTFSSNSVEYRIKPQQQQSSCCKCQQTCSALKEPQYLYVYKGSIGHEPIFCFARSGDRLVEQNYIGKIKLEQDDE